MLLFILFLAALGLAAGLITARIVAEDDPAGGSGASGASPEIATIADFDPAGDGVENPDTVRFAVDDDASTAWSSETYETRDLGGLKDGVGLVLALTAPTAVSSVEIDGAAGADVEIYVADQAAASLGGWGPVRAQADDIADDATIAVDPAATGAAVLVWFTRTPESGRIDVAELRVG
jgi:hypothetical protein